MNIRNDFQPVQPIAADAVVSTVQRASANPDAHPASISGDQAHLSGAASLASQAASLPDVRGEKVQSVQAAIASGNYNVSSSDVAQSLINHLLGGRE